MYDYIKFLTCPMIIYFLDVKTRSGETDIFLYGQDKFMTHNTS